MNNEDMNGSLTANESSYRILCLPGKGKCGYSYLAERDGQQAAVKTGFHQISVTGHRANGKVFFDCIPAKDGR